MGGDLLVGLQLRDDAAGELLAELNAPLIEAVDVPDDALDENLVLVHRDESAEGLRGNLLHKNGVRRTVALEDLERNDVLHLIESLALVQELLLNRLFGLAEGKGLGLGEEVGEQLDVVIADGLPRPR